MWADSGENVLATGASVSVGGHPQGGGAGLLAAHGGGAGRGLSHQPAWPPSELVGSLGEEGLQGCSHRPPLPGSPPRAPRFPPERPLKDPGPGALRLPGCGSCSDSQNRFSSSRLRRPSLGRGPFCGRPAGGGLPSSLPAPHPTSAPRCPPARGRGGSEAASSAPREVGRKEPPSRRPNPGPGLGEDPGGGLYRLCYHNEAVNRLTAP